MPKKGTSKADGTLTQKELDTLKKANEKSRSPASIAKRKATFAANRALKEQLGTPMSRVSPLVEDYLRQSLLFPDEKTGKPYLHVFIDNFLKEAKANPGSIPGQRLAAAMFTPELLSQLDEEVNKQMSKDLEFTYYRIRQTLYNKQQEVFDNDRDKIIMALCSRRVGKCWAPGTKIRLFDGNVKKVEDIEVGDVLMGYDNTPRKVLSTTRGKDLMYKVHSSRDDMSFICNSAHILTVWDRNTNTLVDKPLSYFLEHPASATGYSGHYRLLRAKINYPEKEHKIDPYILGLWLGDGNKNDAQIAIGKDEKELIEFAQNSGWHEHQCKNAAPSWRVLGMKVNLRQLNLLGNKHIPQEYKIDSIENRLELLAGLVDSDGWHESPGSINICLSDKTLFDDVLELIQSLGFHTIVRGPIPTSYKKDGVRIRCKDAYSVTFKGDLDLIPNKVSRKQGVKSKQNLGYGFTIDALTEGDYYGFTVEGDGRVLLADYTINHNTEMAARLLAKEVVRPNRHCVYINRSFDAAVRQIKNPLESTLEKVGLSYSGTINGGKLDFENGSWILIIGNNNAADVNKLRGEKLSCVICDEAGHMRHLREMFQEVIMPATMDYEDAHIYMIGTPPRIPNGFVHELWESAKPAKYHWTFMDNPYIPNRDKVIEEACELYSVSPDSAFIKREYLGDMDAADFDAMPFHNNMKYDKLPDNVVWERAYVGVDYGFDDRAAVVTVLVKDKKAFIYDCWCNNKQTVTALCDEVERQVANAKKLPLGNSAPMIITDTNEKAITAELYYQRHLNNVFTAYKYDLQYGLEQLSEWMKNGTFSTPKDCWINEECENTIWKRDEETGKIIHELDDDIFHPNALFAVLYISRQFAYEVLSLSDNNKQAKEISQDVQNN